MAIKVTYGEQNESGEHISTYTAITTHNARLSVPNVGYVDVMFSKDRMSVFVLPPPNLREKIFCEYECVEVPKDDNCSRSGTNCPCRFVSGSVLTKYAEVYQNEELGCVFSESATIYLPLGFDSMKNPSAILEVTNTHFPEDPWRATYTSFVGSEYVPLTNWKLRPHKSLEESSNG